jgi:mannose-6-phosphate isomerase-like protein (cupin superfamily)
MNQSNQGASPNRPTPRRITSSDGELLSLLGAEVRLKITSREALGTYCVCEGRLPPGSFVPLHYHAEVEAFIVLKGTLEVLQMKGADADPFSVEAGEMAFIPSNAVHGFRNTSGVDVQLLIIGGPRIESFLVEAGTPESRSKRRDSGEPDSSEFLRMLEVAKRHGQTFLL